MKRRHTTKPRQFETNQLFYLTYYNVTIDWIPDSTALARDCVPVWRIFYYDIRRKKILTFLRQDRDIPCRRDNYKKWKSKALLRSPQGKHKQEQCSMHKRRHIVITGTQSFSKDKDEPLGKRFCLPMFVLKTLTFITDGTLAISQGQTQGIAVF